MYIIANQHDLILLNNDNTYKLLRIWCKYFITKGKKG